VRSEDLKSNTVQLSPKSYVETLHCNVSTYQKSLTQAYCNVDLTKTPPTLQGLGNEVRSKYVAYKRELL